VVETLLPIQEHWPRKQFAFLPVGLDRIRTPLPLLPIPRYLEKVFGTNLAAFQHHFQPIETSG